MNWHQLDTNSAARELRSDLQAGLSEDEAAERLRQHGRNELAGSGIRNPWRILWEQLTALMVVVLIVAAVASALLGDYTDAIAIGTIVVLNALLGFAQEYRAEKAMAALKKMAVPSVKVRRDGQVRELSSLLLVPGDLMLLEAGNLVAADGRLLVSAGLMTQEAALTGESQPVNKSEAVIEAADAALGDRYNMVSMGTFVTAGRGEALVTETGMRTELGRIARLLHEVESAGTPLQRRLAGLAKSLAAGALSIVAAIFVLGLLRRDEIRLLFLTSVSIGVAAVPEGLPAVVTIALALGAQRMLRRRVLIRKLPAVETLGSVTVICTDKTGTLTQNRMTAEVLVVPGARLNLPEGGTPVADAAPEFKTLLQLAALCNDAVVSPSAAPENTNPITLGDPTETALLEVALRLGIDKTALDRALPRVNEIAFSSERKRMTTVHRLSPGTDLDTISAGQPCLACSKGAVDVLLDRCVAVWTAGHSEPLTPELRAALEASQEDLTSSGMRVLGIAFRPLANPDDDPESGLIFAGMAGIADPPRPEARPAVEKCLTAGIRPVMITGDHPLTARAIASQLGLDIGRIVSGPELERMTPAQLDSIVDSTSVYARVSPEHKLRIVDSLQRRGHIVAMTGDGVNDAPALRRANIGVAMGISGTDVAKETADMVLLDDSFAALVAAVEEGRTIYDNVRKFIRYILATNSGEIWVMLAAPFFGMPLPLLPLQILWMNLVTDGLPALALAAEPAETGAMHRPPYPPSESIFARGLGVDVIWTGLLMASLSLGAGYACWRTGDPGWQTFLFTTLTLTQMANIMTVRSETQSIFRLGLSSNIPLLAAVALTVGLQFALIYTPFLQKVFKTQPLSLRDLILSLSLSGVIFAAGEGRKFLARRQI